MTYKGSNNKVRTLITITKDLKADLEQLAKRENRSFSNLVATILQDYVNTHKN